MVTRSETVIVTHDDPNSDFYRGILTEENGWIIKSDTFATSYTKTTWYRIEEQGETEYNHKNTNQYGANHKNTDGEEIENESNISN